MSVNFIINLNIFGTLFSNLHTTLLILAIGVFFVPVALFFYRFCRLKNQLNKLPGPKCSNVLFGNLSVFTSGFKPNSGIDLYQGNRKQCCNETPSHRLFLSCIHLFAANFNTINIIKCFLSIKLLLPFLGADSYGLFIL